MFDDLIPADGKPKVEAPPSPPPDAYYTEPKRGGGPFDDLIPAAAHLDFSRPDEEIRAKIAAMPEGLRDAIAQTKGFAGVTGITTINAQRDATKPAAIIAVRDGKLEFLKTVAP